MAKQVMKYEPEGCILMDGWTKAPIEDGSFIVISGFTFNTPYQQSVKRLVESLNKFSIPSRIYGMESKGYWQDNCFATNHIILKALRDYPCKNIVWIDADAYFQGYPKLFDDYKYDLGMYYRKPDERRGGPLQCCSGTIFMRNFPPMHQFFEQFIQYLESCDKHGNPQRDFGNMLKDNPDINVDPDFPVEYCTIVVNGSLYIGKSISNAIIIQGHGLKEFGIIKRGCVV